MHPLWEHKWNKQEEKTHTKNWEKKPNKVETERKKENGRQKEKKKKTRPIENNNTKKLIYSILNASFVALRLRNETNQNFTRNKREKKTIWNENTHEKPNKTEISLKKWSSREQNREPKTKRMSEREGERESRTIKIAKCVYKTFWILVLPARVCTLPCV